MILLAHMLLGAAVGTLVKNVPLAIFLAFLSHYLLDVMPHNEYPIEKDWEKHWYLTMSNMLKVLIDFSIGILLIFIFSKNTLIIYICALVANIPDGLTILGDFVPNKILEAHRYFHEKKVHFLKYKKIPVFWRILCQTLAVVVSIVLLKS